MKIHPNLAAVLPWARTLEELSEILTEVGSDHALVGGIAVGYHGRLRATVDVDVLVPRDKLEALALALRHRGYVVDPDPRYGARVPCWQRSRQS